MDDLLDAPAEKAYPSTPKKRYEYVHSFFKFAKQNTIQNLKLPFLRVHNNDGMPKNSLFILDYISRIGTAEGDWRGTIVGLIESHKKINDSLFINSLHRLLPDEYSKDYSILGAMKGGAFPVDHGSKRWTQKKNYKKWVRNLNKPVTRHAATEDLCVGEKSICKGHLGIPRKYMPQFNSPAEITQFTRFVKKAYGIPSHKTRKAAGELKSSQREINKKRVKGLIDDNIINKVRVPILISGDDYVIDGHHRWAAYKLKAPEKKMPAVVIDAPIKDVLGIAVAWGAKHQEF